MADAASRARALAKKRRGSATVKDKIVMWDNVMGKEGQEVEDPSCGCSVYAGGDAGGNEGVFADEVKGKFCLCGGIGVGYLVLVCSGGLNWSLQSGVQAGGENAAFGGYFGDQGGDVVHASSGGTNTIMEKYGDLVEAVVSLVMDKLPGVISGIMKSLLDANLSSCLSALVPLMVRDYVINYKGGDSKTHGVGVCPGCDRVKLLECKVDNLRTQVDLLLALVEGDGTFALEESDGSEGAGSALPVSDCQVGPARGAGLDHRRLLAQLAASDFDMAGVASGLLEDMQAKTTKNHKRKKRQREVKGYGKEFLAAAVLNEAAGRPLGAPASTKGRENQ